MAADLGDQAAAALYAGFVASMLVALESLGPLSDIELHTDEITEAWSGAHVPRKLQIEGDLGARMLHALETALAEGRPRACIVGSDAPTLPASHLEALLASSADIALGPCEDGGYYAISCRRVHPAMFHGVRWSTPSALDDTEHAARACGLTVERGSLWWDVDEPVDLARLL